MDPQINEMITYWREHGIEVLPGTQEAELSAFEHRFGLHFPEVFRSYLRLANGMVRGAWSEDLVHFWSLDEMAEHLGESGSIQRYPFVPFADYSINCWVWGLPIDLSGDVRDEVCSYGPPLELCAPTFSVFATRYVRGENLAPRMLASRPRPHWKASD